MPRSKYSSEEQLALINHFQESGLSVDRFLKTMLASASHTTIKRWLDRYERDGIDGLAECFQTTYYPNI